MSAQELQFIKALKRWVIGLATTAVIGIGGLIFISWEAQIKNSSKLESIEKTQDAQQKSLDEKANMSVVRAVKENLEKEINNKFDIIDGKLNIVLLYAGPTNNYYDNSKNKTK